MSSEHFLIALPMLSHLVELVNSCACATATASECVSVSISFGPSPLHVRPGAVLPHPADDILAFQLVRAEVSALGTCRCVVWMDAVWCRPAVSHPSYWYAITPFWPSASLPVLMSKVEM